MQMRMPVSADRLNKSVCITNLWLTEYYIQSTQRESICIHLCSCVCDAFQIHTHTLNACAHTSSSNIPFSRELWKTRRSNRKTTHSVMCKRANASVHLSCNHTCTHTNTDDSHITHTRTTAHTLSGNFVICKHCASAADAAASFRGATWPDCIFKANVCEWCAERCLQHLHKHTSDIRRHPRQQRVQSTCVRGEKWCDFDILSGLDLAAMSARQKVPSALNSTERNG